MVRDKRMDEPRQTIRKSRRSRSKGEQFSSGMESGKESHPLNPEHEKLLQWLQTVKFRRKLFGGIDEAQLWKKLEELDKLYEAALIAERARYDTLLNARTKAGADTEDQANEC